MKRRSRLMKYKVGDIVKIVPSPALTSSQKGLIGQKFPIESVNTDLDFYKLRGIPSGLSPGSYIFYDVDLELAFDRCDCDNSRPFRPSCLDCVLDRFP